MIALVGFLAFTGLVFWAYAALRVWMWVADKAMAAYIRWATARLQRRAAPAIDPEIDASEVLDLHVGSCRVWSQDDERKRMTRGVRSTTRDRGVERYRQARS